MIFCCCFHQTLATSTGDSDSGLWRRLRLWTLDATPTLGFRGKPSKALQGPSMLSKAFQGHSMPFKAFQGPSMPFNAFQGPSMPFNALQGLPRPFNALQGLPRPFNALQCPPKPSEALRNNQKTSETLRSFQAPSEALRRPRSPQKPSEALQGTSKPSKAIQSPPNLYVHTNMPIIYSIFIFSLTIFRILDVCKTWNKRSIDFTSYYDHLCATCEMAPIPAVKLFLSQGVLDRDKIKYAIFFENNFVILFYLNKTEAEIIRYTQYLKFYYYIIFYFLNFLFRCPELGPLRATRLSTG